MKANLTGLVFFYGCETEPKPNQNRPGNQLGQDQQPTGRMAQAEAGLNARFTEAMLFRPTRFLDALPVTTRAPFVSCVHHTLNFVADLICVCCYVSSICFPREEACAIRLSYRRSDPRFLLRRVCPTRCGYAPMACLPNVCSFSGICLLLSQTDRNRTWPIQRPSFSALAGDVEAWSSPLTIFSAF